MGALSDYWMIWRIRPAQATAGYEAYPVMLAQSYLDENFQSQTSQTLQEMLLSRFHRQDRTIRDRAQAGLCLRCAVSFPILNACKKLERLFGGDKCFSYRDLLPLVLNDDGLTLIVLDQDGKTQQIVNADQAQSSAYKTFSVEILRTFKSSHHSKMSLASWAYLQTKQHPELRDFLSEFGFQNLSDWALLNRARPKQLQRLSESDRQIVEVFHLVYRRDRVQQRSSGILKCPNPSNNQLQEMLTMLQECKIAIHKPQRLFEQLKQIATQLRQFNLWSYREPLEVQDIETGDYSSRPDLFKESLSAIEIEEQEMTEFLHQQLESVLVDAIESGINGTIAKLKASKRYAPLAAKFIPGLQLYYEKDLSLRDIAPLLDMTSWDQARRVLNPGDLLSQVRLLTIQNLMQQILEKAQEKGFVQTPPTPDYLRQLGEQLEAFLDTEIFQAASEEIRAGKNRSMNSVYAQYLRRSLEQHTRLLLTLPQGSFKNLSSS
ncbi:hypothetical protein IFO70_35915 [Phormidium tenue FACHB-886]|nr:hypothetical protein [Phormidium tenue FACHB-886]